MPWIICLLILLLIVLWLECCCDYVIFSPIIARIGLSHLRITKKEIAEYYGVEKRTLDKWIENIPSNLNHAKYKSARILSHYNFWEIQQALGYVEDQKPLYKNTLKTICETNYRAMRDSIKEEYCGISRAIYIKMNVFPPLVAGRILKHIE